MPDISQGEVAPGQSHNTLEKLDLSPLAGYRLQRRAAAHDQTKAGVLQIPSLRKTGGDDDDDERDDVRRQELMPSSRRNKTSIHSILHYLHSSNEWHIDINYIYNLETMYGSEWLNTALQLITEDGCKSGDVSQSISLSTDNSLWR